MEIFQRTDKGMRALLVAAALVVVISGMKAAQPIILPFLASAMIAVLFVPAITWLQRKKVPDALSIPIVLLGVLALFALLTLGVGKSIADFNENLYGYRQNLTTKYDGLIGDVSAFLGQFGITVSADVITEQLDPSVLLGYVGDVAGAAADLLSNTFLIVLTVMFIVGEAAGFPRKLSAAFPSESGIEGESHDAVASIRSYLRIKTELSLATGSVATLFLAIAGVDYPILWGFLAFVLNFVPNVGSIVAAVPPTLLAFVGYDWQRALVVMIGYAVINTVIGNVLEPRLMGRKLGLSSLVVWLSLVFWGWVWGPIGMLLSVPLTMMVKLLLERSDDLRWVAVLLGPAAEAENTADREPARRRDDHEAVDTAGEPSGGDSTSPSG